MSHLVGAEGVFQAPLQAQPLRLACRGRGRRPLGALPQRPHRPLPRAHVLSSARNLCRLWLAMPTRSRSSISDPVPGSPRARYLPNLVPIRMQPHAWGDLQPFSRSLSHVSRPLYDTEEHSEPACAAPCTYGRMRRARAAAGACTPIAAASRRAPPRGTPPRTHSPHPLPAPTLAQASVP